jgi:hypothetical protein
VALAIIDNDNFQGFGSSISGPVNVTLPVGTLVVAGWFSDDVDAALTSFTDDGSNSYTPLLPFANSNAADSFTSGMAYSVLATELAVADEISLVVSAGTALFAYIAISGADQDPFDDYAVDQDESFPQGSACVSGNIATAQADEILVGWNIAQGAGRTITVTPDFTETIQGDTPGAVARFQMETQVVSSIGSYGTNAAVSPDSYWNSHIAAFEAAGAAPTTDEAKLRQGLTPLRWR